MYKNYIFDLYGTLVDIHTDEENREVWEKLCLFYGYYGAHDSPRELEESYKNLMNVKAADSHYSHEAYPEIKIETIFLELFTAKNVQADETLVRYAGQLFRVLTTEYIRLYEGADRVLKQLRRQGKGVYLLTNAQQIFTEYELHMLDIIQYFDIL